jgi:chemotaxis protein MotB
MQRGCFWGVRGVRSGQAGRGKGTFWLGVAVALTVGVGGCVTTGKYEAKDAELSRALKREEGQTAENVRLNAELEQLRRKYDTAAATIGEMKQRLQQVGQNVDQLSSERGKLAAGLEDAEKRLEEARRQKAAAEAQAATFRNLVAKLRSMIDAGQLKVTIRNGRMLIVLPNDVLFDSGRIDLKAAGKTTLTQVAQVLAGITDRRFLVAGHTDNVPIKTARFPSNWELSTGRAVEVAKLLVGSGMRPEAVGAAGYAEFAPVSANDTIESRAQNRRIEIILEPNLSDLPNLESLISEAKR